MTRYATAAKAKATTTARPFASIKRVGVMTHWRIGPIGGSVYRTRKPYKMPGVIGMVIAAAIGTLAACTAPIAATPSWSVILTVANGNEYVVDHGLTLEDCNAAIATNWPDARCELEPAR